MSAEPPPPFVGLAAFTRRMAAYFTGRERFALTLAGAVLGSRVTVMYGQSGCGKTSVLGAALPQALYATLRRAAAVTQRPPFRLLYYRRWHPGFEKRLFPSAAAKLDAPKGVGLVTAVASWERDQEHKPPVVLVLDQFEEFLLYHPKPTETNFIEELATVIGDPEIQARVLISLREDSLAGLDALRAVVPEILSSLVQLRPLERRAAEQAIRRPVERWGEDHYGDPQYIKIEPSLVEELLDQLGQATVELPFLQLTLQQLWGEMQKGDKRSLDRALLAATGGVNSIVEAHTREKLDGLCQGQRLLAADIFHYLVTPSGGKMAYSPKDLAAHASDIARRPIDEGVVAALLRRLAAGDKRVLRQIGDRFELFHDRLAGPVLKWRAEYLKDAPFAELIEATTGKRFPLRGYGEIFGRFSDYPKTTSVGRSRAVSRHHIFITKTGEILDMRSSYGTTVNAKSFHVGERGRILKSGDVIGLANRAAVVFWTVNDAPPEGRIGVGKGWGLLIDGDKRLITSLGDPTLYLAIGRGGELIAQVDRSPGAFAMLRRDDAGKVRISALTAKPPLTCIWREDSYHDGYWDLAPGAEYILDVDNIKRRPPNYSESPHSRSDWESAERGLYRLGDRRFEIIVHFHDSY